ncbi:MAG: dihydrodipicolinate synthase family protein [Desulfurococcales archaeon]|nr:dihydrodipicolinate synthase family protein [Desulfurococcales archaeon]
MGKRVLEGLVVATITPYTPELRLDIEAYKWLVEKLVDRGVSGIFIGTTGEWPLLSIKERIKLYEAAMDAAKGRASIIGVVTGINVDDTLNNAHLAADTGLDALASVPPLYFKPSNDRLRDFYVNLSAKVDKPVIIYTIPSLVGYNIPVSVVRDIAVEVDGVKGIKATVEDLTYILDLISEVKQVRRDFSILPGYGEYLLASLVYGGDGVVDAVSNTVPGLGVKIIEEFREGRLEEARRLHARFYRVAKLFRSQPLQSLIKKVLSRLGAPITPYVRPPLAEAHDEVASEIASLLCSEYRNEALCAHPKPDYQHI